jgi:hypothetical protein
VFISDGPALSLLSDNADPIAAAPQLTEVASQSVATAEQDLELQIDEDAELFEGGAGGPDAGAVFGETAEKLAALSEPPDLPPAVQQQQAQAAIESAKQAVSTVPGTVVPGMDGVQDKELLKRMGKVKFIAGMIAVHRPNVADCGALAKEIVEVSTQKKLDPFFVAAIVSVESRFGVDARSKAGALGLMQLLPETARDVMRSETGKRGYPMLTHSRTNITLGVEYIRNMIARYRGNRFYALAAYNWGPANVDRVGSANGIPRSVRKYAETVLERATSWKRHFESAEKSASSLAQSELARRTLG